MRRFWGVQKNYRFLEAKKKFQSSCFLLVERGQTDNPF